MTTLDTPRFVPTTHGYLMVLRQGDDVFANLVELTQRMNIPSASLVGLGFANATFGFWGRAASPVQPSSLRQRRDRQPGGQPRMEGW